MTFENLPSLKTSNQTASWNEQSLRYITSTINADLPNAFKHFISTLPENIAPVQILDVGCGGGQWLKGTSKNRKTA